ncbi:MAG TPA: sigma-70 family RNA polymerase sigma factor [Verrucomicrobiae bacterium]
MTPDPELLARFARTNSEDAFAELVKRHVNLVFSAALRQVNGDEHLAKDVAQTVFTDLARKADSLARRESLTGWLYTSAHFAAAKIVRTENRRRDREEKFMREPVHETAPAADWEKLRPALDDVMHELKETDREAVLLRYFENRSFAEVGAKLGVNENAARMRVERALEKLHAHLTKRGVTTAAALATVISTNAVQLAPAGLAAALTGAAVTITGTGTTFTLMKMLTMTQLKLGLGALVVAGATTALVVQHQTQDKMRAENESLTQQLAQLQTDNQSLSNRLAISDDSKKLPDEQFSELLKLRGEVGVLRNQVGELGKLRAENTQIRKELADAVQSLKSLPSPEQAVFNQKSVQAVNDAKQIGLAMRVWAGDSNDTYPTNIYDMTNELGSLDFTKHVIENFELMNVGTANERYPQMLMLREITPRQTPAGSWSRVYGMADGSVQTITLGDGNFDAWEKAQEQFNPPKK